MLHNLLLSERLGLWGSEPLVVSKGWFREDGEGVEGRDVAGDKNTPCSQFGNKRVECGPKHDAGEVW